MIRRRWRWIGLTVLAVLAAAGWSVYAYLPYAGEVLVASASLKTNEPAPAFKLPGSSGTDHALVDYAGKIVVLEWTSPVCEFTVQKYQSGAVQAIQKAATSSGVVWLQISSARPGTDSHLSPAGAKALIGKRGLSVTDILLDDSGAVGKAYGARATPTVAIVDSAGVLRYYGAFDDAPWGDYATAGQRFAEAALAAVKAGRPADPSRTRAYGCFIPYGP
jgi:peroxiredoxin